MKFTKMQGIGNDYVYVNCLEETVENPGEVARKVSDRHFGIGSDGLILIKPSLEADFEMDMYNSDGSQGAMCGNGIRCVAKYVYDYGLTDKDEISIEEKGWSLTPGAYVGVAPVEDDGVDFEERMAEIHRELLALQAESNDLMNSISRNMKEMGL